MDDLDGLPVSSLLELGEGGLLVQGPVTSLEGGITSLADNFVHLDLIVFVDQGHIRRVRDCLVSSRK